MHVAVTFARVQNRSKDLPLIASPMDLTEIIGTFELNQFMELKDALCSIVEYKE